MPGRGRSRSSSPRGAGGADVPEVAIGRGARESVWIRPARRHAPKGEGGGPRFLLGRLGHCLAVGFARFAGRADLNLRRGSDGLRGGQAGSAYQRTGGFGGRLTTTASPTTTATQARANARTDANVGNGSGERPEAAAALTRATT